MIRILIPILVLEFTEKIFFFELDDKEEKLGNLLKSHIHYGTQIQGSIIRDMWDDIGTIERLNNLRKKLT